MKKIIVLVALLLSVNVYADDADTATQRELRTLVRDFLGGESTDSKWPDANIDRQVNLGGQEYALLVGIPKLDTIVTTSGGTEYALNSDFLRIRGVAIYNENSDNREKALQYRSPRVLGSATKALGEDDDDTHPKYYTVTGGETNAGKFLKIDPPEEESDRDTLIIYYFAQANELGGADTLTNIPYEGIPMVVYAAVRNCLIKNREYPNLPILQTMYDASRAVLIQEQSDMEYEPSR